MFAFIPALLAAAAVVSASPALPARSDYQIDVSYPTSTTHWFSGTQNHVDWDASKVPADAEPLEWVDLYTWQSHSGGHSVARLATNVDPRSGSINVNVPAGLPVGNYWIVFAGHPADASSEFEVNY